MTTDPSRDQRRPVVLGPAAHELRLRVGTSGWVVLEEMMQHSRVDADERVAAVSIRSLAASLGLAKDTVHRAMTRLREVGVVEPHQVRTSAGVFGAGGYRLSVPAVCLSIPEPSNAACLSPLQPVIRAGSRSRRSSGQLALAFEN